MYTFTRVAESFQGVRRGCPGCPAGHHALPGLEDMSTLNVGCMCSRERLLERVSVVAKRVLRFGFFCVFSVLVRGSGEQVQDLFQF